MGVILIFTREGCGQYTPQGGRTATASAPRECAAVQVSPCCSRRCTNEMSCRELTKKSGLTRVENRATPSCLLLRRWGRRRIRQGRILGCPEPWHYPAGSPAAAPETRPRCWAGWLNNRFFPSPLALAGLRHTSQCREAPPARPLMAGEAVPCRATSAPRRVPALIATGPCSRAGANTRWGSEELVTFYPPRLPLSLARGRGVRGDGVCIGVHLQSKAGCLPAPDTTNQRDKGYDQGPGCQGVSLILIKPLSPGRAYLLARRTYL